MSAGSLPPSAPRPSTLTADHLAICRREARRITRRHCACTLPVEDFEQEAALAALTELSRLAAAGVTCDPGPYLTVAVRCHLSRLATAELRRADPLYPLVGDPFDPRTLPDRGDNTQNTSLAELLEAHGASLTAQQRCVLQLAATGRDDALIARLLATSEGCVRSARSQALARLREELIAGG